MDFLVYIQFGLARSFFLVWCIAWIMHLTAIINGKLKLHRKSSRPSLEVPLPGVSILKPLVGTDPNLFTNLETFFTLNYTQYELLFCINDESDPSIILVERLMEKYPKVDAHIFTGGLKVSVNPKVNNMQPGYLASKYDLILISDSRIHMKEDTLFHLVSEMGEDVAQVHQMPSTSDRKGFPAILEKVCFCTIHARAFLTADFFGIQCTSGMSALIRKKVLDEVGGLKVFGKYLAEDYFYTKSMRKRGWKIRLSSLPTIQNSGLCNITIFNERIMRWIKLRLKSTLPATILEPMMECMLSSLLAAWSTHYLFLWDPKIVVLIHLLLWFLFDCFLLSIVQNGCFPFSIWEYLSAWLFRECTATYLFFKALANPLIHWQTRTFHVRWGGLTEEVHMTSKYSI